MGPLPALEGQPVELFWVFGMVRVWDQMCVFPAAGLWHSSTMVAGRAPRCQPRQPVHWLCPSAFSAEPGIPTGGSGGRFGLVAIATRAGGRAWLPQQSVNPTSGIPLACLQGLYCLFLWGKREDEDPGYSEDL